MSRVQSSQSTVENTGDFTGGENLLIVDGELLEDAGGKESVTKMRKRQKAKTTS